MDYSKLRQELMKTANQFHRLQKGHLCQGMAQGELFIIMQIGRYCSSHPEENGISVSKIADFRESSMQVVCRTLRGMECKGYIERHQSKRDRRNTQVILTEYGWKMHDKVAGQMNAFADRVIERFGEENTKQLISLMQNLAEIVQEESSYEEKKKEERERK